MSYKDSQSLRAWISQFLANWTTAQIIRPAITLSSTLAVTGATTLTGGLASPGTRRISTIPLGSVAYGSLGTDTTPANGTTFYTEIWIPSNVTLAGAAVLNGSAAATDKVCFFLFNNAGTLVAQTAAAGTTASGTNAFQEVAFTATYAAKGPARYWLAYQANGNTTRFRSVAASTFLVDSGSSTGDTFGTKATITPPTTFTADKAPIMYVYQ